MSRETTDSSRESPYFLEEFDECDGCGKERPLAVTESGRYCWECIPDDDLRILLRDLHTGG